MGQIKRMNEMIRYIENNLKKPIDYNDLTKITYLSKFHLHRLFVLLANIGLGEYIRKRRLTKAAYELISKDKSITDIAYDYQYSSSSAFSRAFSKLHGFAPSKIEKNKIKAYPMISFQLEVKGVNSMNYKIIEKEAFKVIGKQKRISTINEQNYEEIPKFWSENHANGFVSKLMEFSSNLGILGVCMDMNEKDEEFNYMIAIEENEDLRNNSLKIVDIPESKWAVFKCVGPMPKAMQDVWKRIYSEWFPSTGYEHANSPELEIYPPGNPNDESYISEIWIPIKNSN